MKKHSTRLILVSTDKGTSWSVGNYIPEVRALAISDSTFIAGIGSGVVQSTDNGTTWTATSSNPPTRGVYSMAVSVHTIVVGDDQGSVFLSTNAGKNWSATTTPGLQYSPVYSLAISGNNLFAGTSTGLFLSTNGGKIWTAHNSGLVNTVVQSLVINGGAIFAGTNGAGIWRRPLSEMLGISPAMQ